jgi:hypothetical protein
MLKGDETVRKRFAWKNRGRDLECVKRYHALRVMFYRTDLLLHSARVQGIVRALLPAILPLYPDLDGELAVLISKFHDDPEIVTGDVPLQLKLLMTEDAHLRLKQEEVAAAELLSKSYRNPKIGGYQYEDLLMHAILKDCPEAQLHSFADKLDGFCEALHEVLAGNIAFLQPVINYVVKSFDDLPARFPLIGEVFGVKDSHFHFPVIELAPYFEHGSKSAFLHTPESLTWSTGISHYELWKRVTLSLPSGMERLTKQVEFHPR